MLPSFAVPLVGAAFVDPSAAQSVAGAPSGEAGGDVTAYLHWDQAGGNQAIRLLLILGTLVIMTPLAALLFYLPTRISLALPATAIDSPHQTFKHAWSASRGSFWRLFWGGLLSYWPFLPIGIASLMSTGVEDQSRLNYVLSQSVGTAAVFVAGLIWVAFFSHAYRHLVPRSG